MTYYRQLSPIERLHAAIGANAGTLEGERTVNITIEGEGDLDVTRWRAALQKTADANPACRVVLRGHLWRARWEEAPASGPRLSVVEGSKPVP